MTSITAWAGRGPILFFSCFALNSWCEGPKTGNILHTPSFCLDCWIRHVIAEWANESQSFVGRPPLRRREAREHCLQPRKQLLRSYLWWIACIDSLCWTNVKNWWYLLGTMWRRGTERRSMLGHVIYRESQHRTGRKPRLCLLRLRTKFILDLIRSLSVPRTPRGAQEDALFTTMACAPLLPTSDANCETHSFLFIVET